MGQATVMAEPVAGRTITHAAYLELVGLLTLADRLNERIEDIWASALRITGEEDEVGLTCAAIYDHDDASAAVRARRLLTGLGVTVRED